MYIGFLPYWLRVSTIVARPRRLRFLKRKPCPVHRLVTLIGCAPLLPDGVVSSTEVDEEIPAPVPHGQQVGHAAEVHGQQAGATPDGGHAPGRHPHIGILSSQGLNLPMQVVGALKTKDSDR